MSPAGLGLRRAATPLAALLAVGALAGAARAEGDPVWKTAYAKVGAVPILRADVDADTKRGVPPAQALQRRISLEVLRQGLQQSGVDPAALPEAELTAALEEAASTLKAMGRTLEDVLAGAGQTREQFREELRIPTAFRVYVRGRVSDDQVRASCEAGALRIAGQVRAMHILVTVRKDRDEVAARARAQELIAQLGEEPTREAFAALAREASDDPMASLTDGDLDWFPLGATGSCRRRSRAQPSSAPSRA